MSLFTCFKLFFLVCLYFPACAQDQQPHLPKSKHHFIVIAHRGDHEHVPENTVASIREAIKAGVDYVELDLRTTKDGYLVLMHDASINRMTNGKGNVRDLTLDAIKALEISGGDKIYRVPEFKEVLQACQNRINIYLDFKDANVDETYRQLKQFGMEKHVVVYLNKESQYGEWRRAAPYIPLMTSLPDNIKTEAEFDKFLGSTQIEVFDNLYDPDMISFAKKRKIAVWLDVKRENENAQGWQKILSEKVQGMQTDHPEELIKYLAEKNAR